MAAVQRASVCFFWRAHCRMSQRGLGNGLCWPCQPCAAQPPWHAPPLPRTCHTPALASTPRPPPSWQHWAERVTGGLREGPHSTGRRRHDEVCVAMCAACGALGATTVCWVHHTAVGHLGWQQSQGVGLTTPGACSGTFITTSPVCPLTPSCLPKELSASPPPKCQRPAHRASRHQTPRYRLWPRDCSHGAP